MFTGLIRRHGALRLGIALAVGCLASTAALAQQPLSQIGPEPVIHRIQAATERMEMTVNSSRMITLDQKIPRAQVNNREILELTPLSPNEIQVSAKKPGVTQINLWNEQGQVYAIDVIVYGDARELAMLLQTEFPHAAIRVRPLANSVVLSGMVDRPDEVSQIIRIAEDYYPKVISHISVGGVQQVLLHVKVMEVSRTKLRALGFDFGALGSDGFLITSISGLIQSTAAASGMVAGGGQTVAFGLVDGNTAFFGLLDALRRHELMKILAEPTLTTVSGRPAFFQVGGEFPILVPQALGTLSIEYKKFGTQVDFVPIVLGNGNIRLEVRPRVSEIDNARSVTLADTTVPGLRVREVDTGVEMRPGQTLALAGLVQTRVEARNTGIPWLADLPYFGAPFRRVREETNEIELLILVTPELIEGVDACNVPPCGPGMHTDSPTDCEMYWKGYIEVPSAGPCGPGGACPMPNGMHQQGTFEEVPPGAATGGDSARRSVGGNAAWTTPTRRMSSSATWPSPALNAPLSTPYNSTSPHDPRTNPGSGGGGAAPGFIGPTGYDVFN
jgi:pilus assembly protein CpaC